MGTYVISHWCSSLEYSVKTKKVLSKDQTFFLSKGGGVKILTIVSVCCDTWRHLATANANFVMCHMTVSSNFTASLFWKAVASQRNGQKILARSKVFETW